MVRVKHSDYVARCLVYFGRCDFRGVCEFGEVCRCILVGCAFIASPSWYRAIRGLGMGRRNGGVRLCSGYWGCGHSLGIVVSDLWYVGGASMVVTVVGGCGCGGGIYEIAV